MQLISKRKSAKLFAVAAVCAVGIQLAACGSREERAENYYKNGMSYLEKEDFAKARVEFRNALQLKDDSVEAWRGLLKVDEHDKSIPGLAQDLRRIVELDDKDVDAKVRLATLLLASGSLDQSLKLANAASDLRPDNATVLALKAAILFKLQDKTGALEQAKKAVAIDPHNVEANAVLATQQIYDNDLNGALETLVNIPPEKETEPGVALLKVDVLSRLKQTAKLEEFLKHLTAAKPNDRLFRNLLLRFYLANNRANDAEAELRTLAKSNPKDEQVEFEFVNLLASTKGPDAARAELEAKIADGGETVAYKVALANLDFRQGKTEDGKRILQKLIDEKTTADSANRARNALAQMYVGRREFGNAEPLIAAVLDSDRRNTDALFLRSSIKLDRGQYDEAIADLRRGLNDEPNSPPLLLNLAVAYERSGSIELAAKAYLDATKASSYAVNYGMTYFGFLERRGYAGQAQTLLDELAKRHPSDLTVLTALARDKMSRQDWAGAHNVAEAIRRLDNQKAVADQIDGAAFTGQKKFDEGLSALKEAYEASQGAVQPMAALVNAYIRAGQVESAEGFLNSVLKSNPKNSEAIVLLGAVDLAKNNVKGAEEDFKRAISLRPDDAAAYRALANLYILERKPEDALRVVYDALGKQPKNFSLRMTLAGLLELRKDYDGAIAEYESMLKDEPGSLIVVNNLASLLSDYKTDQTSKERARSLASLLKGSTVPQFLDTYGWVNYQQGNFNEALPALRTAAERLSGAALVQYHLALTYAAAGDREKASAIWQKALELAKADPALKAKIEAARDKIQGEKTATGG